MSLFSRLFSPRRNQKKETTPTQSVQNNGPNSFTTFSIEKDQVRVLLFRECDWRGRKLLFDSSSVQKVALDPQNPVSRIRRDSKELIVEISNGFGYQYKRPNQDITVLGEAVFGSVAMASRGHSFKVHLLKEPHRIMLTKVVLAPQSKTRKRHISDRSLDDSISSSINSISDYYNSSSYGSKSGSLDRGLHRITTQDDSGFSRESSNLTSSDWLKHSSGNCDCVSYCPMRYSGLSPKTMGSEPGNSSNSLIQSNPSGSSLSSLRRRWNRSMDTSMNLSKYILPSSQIECGSSIPELIPTQIPSGKRTKLGIALLVPIQENQHMEMERFLLERLSLLINILTRLQHGTEQAYLHKDIFVQSMMDASQQASQSVCDLISALRIETPIWLTLTSNSSDNALVSELSTKFMQDFSHLLQSVDTKHTNFFVSTLLTAVLTHHLGWIPTVISDLQKNEHSDQLLADLSRNHPYNPFWAQQSDLRGALCFPMKTARTIVIGQSEALVSKLLSVLSYFIRCGQVAIKERDMEILHNDQEIITDIIESKQTKYDDETDFYNQIREFNQTKSFGGSTSGSSSTLCKSKTVLSLKTFSINNEDVSNTVENDLEFSNFGCFDKSLLNNNNDVHHSLLRTGEKLSVLKKTKSFVKLKDSSVNNSSSEDMYEKNIQLSALKGSNNSLTQSKTSLLAEFEGKIRLFNESDRNTSILKVDLEKQLSSVDFKNVLNRNKSELSNVEDKSHSFLKQNLLRSGVSTEKEERVVFVLGENEKLIDIKNHDKINYEIQDWNENDTKNTIVNKENPLILIDDFHNRSTTFDTNLNYLEERKKTEFIGGDVDSRIIIVKSTPIDIEGNTHSLRVNHDPFPRCLSVPEVVFATESFKMNRSKDAAELIRRWFSDSDIVPSRRFDDLPSNICDKTSKFSIGESDSKPFRTSCEMLDEGRTKSVKCFSSLMNEDDTSSCGYEEMNSTVMREDKINDKLEIIELPLIRNVEREKEEETNLAKSMLGGVNDHYIPELVLQGVSQVAPGWEAVLKKDLMLEAHATELESDVTESVCIIANTDTWEVLLVSSHTVVLDKTVGGIGIRVGMSHLVANIMETTHHLCKLAVPPHVCLSHIESKLSELCIRSHALAEMLLTSNFLDMDTLTSTLDLDPNDVPLLLSVASTHTPQVTREYGLSFQ